MLGFTPFKGQAGFGWRSGIVGALRLENYCLLHNRAGTLPTPPMSLAKIEKACFWLFQESLGRPPKDPEINAAHKQQLRADQRKRNEVEGCLVSGKRKYSLDLIMARLAKGAENSISMAFVVMCAEKIRRLFCLFFLIIYTWFYAFQR